MERNGHVTEIRTHPDGSTTIGPRDPYRDLIDNLAMFADLTTDKEAVRKLAWFLGDRGEQEAAQAIMKHAAVREPTWYGTPMWGYIPVGGVP